MTHTEILTRALELLAVSTFYNPELQAKRTDVIEKGLEALAQPEQEPVGHREGYWCVDLTCKKCYSADFRLKHTPPQRTQPNDIDLFWRAVTTPEKWVGLTAEEVLQCWEKAHEPGNEGLINAIRMADEVEQALKEKNCG